MEQKIIVCSVEVDIEQGITSSALPFVFSNPDLKLVPNGKSMLKNYKNQITILDRRPADKLAVIESENKLQRLSLVDYVENLTDKETSFINGKLQNCIPWRVVWNENSVSTPCRLVFDASHKT